DAIDHRSRVEFEIPGGVGLRKFRHQDGRFRTDMAAKGLAKAAIAAAGPPAILLRKNRARGRERMIAEAARGFIENDTGLFDDERRQGIFALPRAFEHVPAVDLASLQIAGFARN